MRAGVNAIIQKIHEDAESLAAERLRGLTGEIDRHFDEEMNAHRRELARHCESLTKQKQRELEVSLERKRNSLERDLLAYQHQLLDDLFGMVVRELRDMPQADFVRLFEAAVRGLTGEYELQLGEHSAGRLSEADIGRACGDQLAIRLAGGTRPGRSGFLLLSPNVEYNCFFEDIVADLKERRAAMVLKEVFGS